MSYAPYLSGYKGPDQEFLSWNQTAKFPFHDYFRNNPLSQTTTIDPRMAGFRPYKSGINVSPYENVHNDCAVYQYSSDLILPANKCYLKNPVIVTQP